MAHLTGGIGPPSMAGGQECNLAGAMALAAGAGDTEESLLEANLAITAARRAGRGARSLLRAASIAFRAALMSRDFDLGGCAERSLFEGDVQIVSQIGAALSAAASAAAAEHVAETKKVAENVAKIGKHARIKATESAAGGRADSGMSETIVLAALTRVAQNRVRFGSFFEFLFGFLVSVIAIRMVL